MSPLPTPRLFDFGITKVGLAYCISVEKGRIVAEWEWDVYIRGYGKPLVMKIGEELPESVKKQYQKDLDEIFGTEEEGNAEGAE